jgi:LytS/YehU family sensor histidine kinase
VGSSTSSNFDAVSFASWSFTINKPVYFQWWFILGVLLISWFLVYLIIKWYDRKKIRDAQIAREKILSQFELLKSQVNPHFLFNSLNTLNALIYKEPKEATDYLLKLSDFLRVMLTRNDNVTHFLGEELTLTGQYGFLQKKRFGDNLIIKTEIPDELLNRVLIPPLTLQILLENAIKHNVASRTKPLTIQIFKEGDQLVVKNNLQEIKEKKKSTGIGLSNISNRYRIIFGKEIEIKKTDDYFTVKLPLIFSNHEDTDY